jgi:hypothetical protein
MFYLCVNSFFLFWDCKDIAKKIKKQAKKGLDGK